MLNQYHLVKVTPAMADLTQRPLKQIIFPEGCLLSCQKSHRVGGAQDDLPQTTVDRRETSFNHYLAIVIF